MGSKLCGFRAWWYELQTKGEARGINQRDKYYMLSCDPQVKITATRKEPARPCYTRLEKLPNCFGEWWFFGSHLILVGVWITTIKTKLYWSYITPYCHDIGRETLQAIFKQFSATGINSSFMIVYVEYLTWPNNVASLSSNFEYELFVSGNCIKLDPWVTLVSNF